MPILDFTTNVAGQIGDEPRRVIIKTTDNLATVTAANYIQNTVGGTKNLQPSDIIDMYYGWDNDTNTGTFGQFTVSFGTANAITLVLYVSPGDVLLPVVSGNFSTFNGITGQIKDAGFLPSDATKTKVVMSGSSVAINNIAHFVDVNGTIDDTAATVVNPGSIQAGSSGVAGTIISFPTTAAKGHLSMTGVANTGDTITTISNAAMGQASVVSIPDPAGATANFVIAPAALVSGNMVKASGVAGLLVDAGFAVLAKTTASYAGGGTSNAFTATGLGATSIVTASILESTNAISIVKVVPTANVLTVTFSADPGASTTVSYISITPAV